MKYVLPALLAVLFIGCAGPAEETTDAVADPIQVDNYSIEQFYENTRIYGGSFSADESKLLVSSDETGIFNVYEIDIA